MVVDVFSKFAWTFLLRTHKDAEVFERKTAVGDDMLALFLREGAPRVFVTDNEWRGGHHGSSGTGTGGPSAGCHP